MPRKMCFDKILLRDLRRAHRIERTPTGRSRAIAIPSNLWPNGSRLRIRFVGGSAQHQSLVKQHAAQWTQHANLTLDFGDAPDADIRVAFADDGAWSYIGTDAKGIPLHEPTLNLGWVDEAVILHEFGHAIGLAHEHQHPELTFQWNEAAVIRDLSGPPNNWDEATIRHNVFEKYRHDQVNGTEFDPSSIMLYAFPPEWTIPPTGTTENTKLSTMDKLFVAGAKMYPGRGTTPKEVELPVGEIKATAASIGQAGEEDLFTFTARSAGRYTIETEGETDLMMKLYGPDSRTRLVAQDDDSGQGFNPQIVANLAPGRYLIQVRHYNRTRGTGPYGIKIYR